MQQPLSTDTRHEALSTRDSRILLFLLVISTGLLVAGLSLPMMSITRLLMFTNSFSVFGGVYQLWQNGDILLFLVVAGFSIVIPFIKIAILLRLVLHRGPQSPGFQRLLHLMHEYGRWSMLDVMVVAVLIVTVKLRAIASIRVHSGLIVFGLAMLLLMLVTRRVVQLTRDPQG